MTDLDKLSAAATGGEWSRQLSCLRRVNGPDGRSIFQAHLHGKDPNQDYKTADANAAFICAAVNALRAGELVEAGPLRELVKQLADMARNAHVKETSYHDGRATAYEFCADALAALIGEGE